MNYPPSLKLHDATQTKNRLKIIFMERGSCMGDSLSWIILSCSYYIIKLPHARDPISSTWRDRPTIVESDVFRRWNPLYVCCVDILTIFVLLFQKYILLSQRECFCRRYWLTCRPIARQSTQMLREASEEIFASVRLVLTCLDKALHAQAISTCFSWNKYLLYVQTIFCCLFVIAVLIVRSMQWIQLHWPYSDTTCYYLNKLGLCSRKYRDHQRTKRRLSEI